MPAKMPRFYFDVCVNGQVVPDPEGLPLAQLSEAKFEAVVALAEMMVEAIRDGTHRSMDVAIRGDDRRLLARVSMLIREDLS